MNATHLIFFFFGGATAISAPVGAPTDDDTVDGAGNTLTITARTDCGGATLRPPRVTLLHALDGARNASLVGPDRLDMDRHTAYSMRAGRTPNSGYSLRLRGFTLRAGECFAPKSFLVTADISTPSSRGPDAADTTQRTDCDGATLHVPTRYVFYAAESARNGDLVRVGEDRDRHVCQMDVEMDRGPCIAHRVRTVTDGRAGGAGAVREITLIATVEGPLPIAAADI